MPRSTDPNLSQVRALLEVAKWSEALKPEERPKSLAERQRTWQATYRLEDYVRSVLGDSDNQLRLLAPKGEGLTDEGLLLAGAADGLIKASEEFVRAIRALSSRSRSLSLGCFPSHALLVGHAAKWLKSHGSETDIRVVASDDVLRLDGGKNLVTHVQEKLLDVAIAPTGVKTGSLARTPLYSWNLIVVVPEGHELYGQASVHVHDLKADHRLMASPPSHRTRNLLEDAGLNVPIWFSSASVDALCGLAEAGQGAAIVAGDSYPVLRSDPLQSRHWPVLVSGGKTLGGSFDVIYRKRAKKDDPVSQLVSALHEAAQNEPLFKNNPFVEALRASAR
jgi:DNA-binding transcriptional LysR family regulator